MRTLLIDDEKDIVADRVEKTYLGGINALQTEKWDVLYLDHDLGDFDANKKEWTGMDVLIWIVEHREHCPKKIQIFTNNIIARQYMRDYITRNKLGAKV